MSVAVIVRAVRPSRRLRARAREHRPQMPRERRIERIEAALVESGYAVRRSPEIAHVIVREDLTPNRG